jgi:Thioredoxin
MPAVQGDAPVGRRRGHRHVHGRNDRIGACGGGFLGGVVWARRMISPVLEDLAKRHAGHLKVVKVDVDANRGLASRFGARSIPLLVVIREGKEVDRVVGALPRAALEQRLGPALTP